MKLTFKKMILALIMCFPLSFSAIGCSSDETEGQSSTGAISSEVTVSSSDSESEESTDTTSSVSSSDSEESVLKDFTGITFNGLTVDYNGSEHTIVATGIPEGANVSYTNAGPFVNAGEYTISISVTAEGYNAYTKSVTLTINKIDFPSDIVFEDEKFFATGGEKELLVQGELPANTEVVYTNNRATEAGVYNASATLKNPNYNEKTLYAKMTIIDLTDTAKNTMDTVMDRPEPWAFMPESFKKENLACENAPTTDFSAFVNVNNINKKFIGQQMYLLWEGVYNVEELLAKFDVVYALGETIATAYQNFINDNPENYAVWTATLAGFNIKIEILGSESKMLIGNNTFSVELYADTENNINKGRVDVLAGGSLNYEMRDDYLKFNVGLTIKGVMTMKQVEFERNEDGVVAGYFYEYTGLESVALKTSAVFTFDEEYAIVVSTKKESDDLMVNGYEEVYSATTGQFLAAEVLETNKLTDYDTFWVNLFDVSGIVNVKAIGNDNTLPSANNHDVYINDSTKVFKPEKGLMGLGSRHFDIEMKTVYYLVEVDNGNEATYEVIETEIPMLFVQKDNVEDFAEEIVDANKNTFDVDPSLPTEEITVAEENLEPLKTLLDTIKENLTYAELVNQLGQRDAFFDDIA